MPLCEVAIVMEWWVHQINIKGNEFKKKEQNASGKCVSCMNEHFPTWKPENLEVIITQCSVILICGQDLSFSSVPSMPEVVHVALSQGTTSCNLWVGANRKWAYPAERK